MLHHEAAMAAQRIQKGPEFSRAFLLLAYDPPATPSLSFLNVIIGEKLPGRAAYQMRGISL